MLLDFASLKKPIIASKFLDSNPQEKAQPRIAHPSPHSYPLHRKLHSSLHDVSSQSVLTKTVLDNKIIEIVALGQFEQVFASAFPEGEVNLPSQEQQLYDVFLNLKLDVTRKNRTEQRRFTLQGLHV